MPLSKIDLEKTSVDHDLKTVLFEMKVTDAVNKVVYQVALVTTRRGITFNVTKKEKLNTFV